MAKRHSNISLLSVIVPAFRQEKTIKHDLLQLISVLDELGYTYEIIVVVDGDIDKTFEYAKSLTSPKVQVTGYEQNLGKGHAVRFGMQKAKGDVIAFIDAGMDINPSGISMLIEHFNWYNADIIVGSKLHPVSKINYPWQRRILSWGYRLLVKVLFGLSIRDTQVGLKFFRREVLVKVLPRLLVKNYAFDIELLAVAYSMGFKRIYEAPVELSFTGQSSITSGNFWGVIYHMLWDTFAVFYRLRVIRYYSSNKLLPSEQPRELSADAYRRSR
jgi:glycosyltransferase involved in cell wall biosynthesis